MGGPAAGAPALLTCFSAGLHCDCCSYLERNKQLYTATNQLCSSAWVGIHRILKQRVLGVVEQHAGAICGFGRHCGDEFHSLLVWGSSATDCH
jgi:hypothetical protein